MTAGNGEKQGTQGDGTRRGVLARHIYEVLSEEGDLRALEVMQRLEKRIVFNAHELSLNDSGQVRWRVAANAALSWSTFGGWLARDENGRYRLTQEGATALAQLTDEELWLEIGRRYRASKGGHHKLGWDGFLSWAEAIAAEVNLDAGERDYKLKAAGKWSEAGAACASDDDDWPLLLKRAAGAGNLVDPFAQTWLRNRISDSPDAVRSAFGDLHVDASVEGIDAFGDALKTSDSYISPGDITTFASAVLLGTLPAEHPPYRASFAQAWAKAVNGDAGDTPKQRYEGLLAMCGELLARWSTAQGAPALRDKLDAQGLAWAVLRWAPPYRWEPIRRAELEAWRSQSPDTVRVDRGKGIQPALEDAAWRTLGAALRGEESSMCPGRRPWTADNAKDLALRLEQGTPGKTFLTRLHEQLTGASDDVLALAAELLHIRDAPLFDMTASTKVSRVRSVLQMLTDGPDVPAYVLAGAQVSGSFRGGQGYHSRAAHHLQWLSRFVEYWCTLDDDERDQALRDPVRFRSATVSTPSDSPAIRYVVEYVAWPGVFPSVVSEAHRRQIRDGLISDLGQPSGTDDTAVTRDLVALRALHEDRAKKFPNWYEAPYVKRWRDSPDPAPRAWLVRGGETSSSVTTSWTSEGFISLTADMLVGVQSGAPEQLVTEAVRGAYQHLDKSQQDELALAYHRFLSVIAEDDLVATVDGDTMRVGIVSGPAVLGEDVGSRLRIPVEWSPAGVPTSELGEPLPTLLAQQGQVIDLTAAYGVVSALVPSDEPTELEPRPHASPVEIVPDLPSVTTSLAERLFMPAKQLQEIVDLLQTRQQMVFYGPPGTGKTFVAKELAKHLAGSEDQSRVRLVQFHPSYAYEDFFEGYRPTSDGKFELVDGPLRLLAGEAGLPENRGKPHFLIIDEMNRANLAKVFGELYFLLEYRRETVRPQYRPRTPFRLPLNLFVIGTMNTADRSIALVDAAIRRRFPFYEMHPGKPPVAGVLEGYMARPGRLADDRVALLEELNLAVGVKGRDLHIGPSYLMRAEVDSPGGLERVWTYDILPLLHEHFYGVKSPEEVDHEFGLATLRKRLQQKAAQSAASGGLAVDESKAKPVLGRPDPS